MIGPDGWFIILGIFSFYVTTSPIGLYSSTKMLLLLYTPVPIFQVEMDRWECIDSVLPLANFFIIPLRTPGWRNFERLRDVAVRYDILSALVIPSSLQGCPPVMPTIVLISWKSSNWWANINSILFTISSRLLMESKNYIEFLPIAGYGCGGYSSCRSSVEKEFCIII